MMGQVAVPHGCLPSPALGWSRVSGEGARGSCGACGACRGVEGEGGRTGSSRPGALLGLQVVSRCPWWLRGPLRLPSGVARVSRRRGRRGRVKRPGPKSADLVAGGRLGRRCGGASRLFLWLRVVLWLRRWSSPRVRVLEMA